MIARDLIWLILGGFVVAYAGAVAYEIFCRREMRRQDNERKGR